ncbi:hypothetical protein KSP40_PGU000770 [Platanthera guangdongensis]|uniref:PP2A regulatory subunit B'' EF-hand domain-containing protein n=1 Tax=Platanthera guangdongensis TaxID=2320717 RepID=A0ABR2LPC8_9ASPA
MIMDIATHIFTIMKQPDRKYLTQEDFKPLLRELLSSHPGLEFLQNTPEFQDRYGELTSVFDDQWFYSYS